MCLNLREIVWDILICPVLILPVDNEGEKGENKRMGEYFLVYNMLSVELDMVIF